MNKEQLATLDLILCTIHLLNVTKQSMSALDHKPEARSLHSMVRTLSKDLDTLVKQGDQP